MYWTALVLPVLSFSLPVISAVIPSIANQYNVRFLDAGNETCSSEQQEAILTALGATSNVLEFVRKSPPINWTHPAAVDYLGKNVGKRAARIQRLLTKWANLNQGTPSPLEIKCDMGCSANAYVSIPGDTVTFCKPWFSADTLEEKIQLGKRDKDARGDMEKLAWNKVKTVAHEFFHMEKVWRTDGRTRDELFVRDVQMTWRTNGKNETGGTYGPTRAKILANFEECPHNPNTGYYTSRSSENLALYVLSRYFEKQFGKYPSEPIVTKAPIETPGKPTPTALSMQQKATRAARTEVPVRARAVQTDEARVEQPAQTNEPYVLHMAQTGEQGPGQPAKVYEKEKGL
ncbi:hypothetical protein M501DRAFT_1056648 [Patellaria atrata CBS 101060]|uniref:Lysine-specific metallo-endopeptidase domain-containing protein n=1 Tax=Patellaria atrata CBS 101060 TaxID=1346257 RepID=A0A9P4VSX3_9PEZI|nr:hypothetical protein M501DRAFT_1056648 [Patellaria atrata CBS 101060]